MEPGLGKGRASFVWEAPGIVQTRSNKRQKELARKEKQRAKQERREERKRERESRPPRGEGEEDPDLVGIVPGPQPRLEDDEEPPDTT